ncbi:zinc finger protein 830-like [Macrosteles quadrilineatus]|uniref:zinc finger protein 830-like n=2 Tax=Macrosteles quadrilineatus TaxID=74068 RepID=UPI0023E21DFC|nr:zinc finger protein 830-like [Macrosteles quadrilineatus]
MSKNKISQNELRRLMSQEKKKLITNGRKIESPLAKYKDDGTLTCIVCESVVRSDAVWIVHLNSKQHKDNIARKKQLLAPPPIIPKNVSDPPKLYKRPLTPPTAVPPKKLKGILKNAPAPKLPPGFFDNGAVKTESFPTSSQVDPSSVLTPTEVVAEEPMDTEDASFVDSKDPLPEGFFDDPIMDAKARNVEYKDPIQEEWEKFQKEIKEETSVSTQIIEDDQEEATTERQIQEIDEQLRNWSRVLDLEKKKETVQAVATKGSSENAREDASDDEEDFDEFLDWRAKKSFK